MDEMTMDFSIRNEHLLDGFVPGDQIDFTLKVTDDDSWIEAVRRTGHKGQPAPVAMAMPAPLKPGDLVPDATLLAENGKQVHLSDFRGKAVAFTFFFTRCPLPNYCPLMNQNLAATRKLLLADPHAPKNWQLLSISFDSEFDTPGTLTSYANFYRAHNPDRWLFASITPQALAPFAAPLGLMVMGQGGNLTHNLRTVVVDPKGRLYRQFNDNTWKPSDLARTIKSAARPSND